MPLPDLLLHESSSVATRSSKEEKTSLDLQLTASCPMVVTWILGIFRSTVLEADERYTFAIQYGTLLLVFGLLSGIRGANWHFHVATQSLLKVAGALAQISIPCRTFSDAEGGREVSDGPFKNQPPGRQELLIKHYHSSWAGAGFQPYRKVQRSSHAISALKHWDLGIYEEHIDSERKKSNGSL
uniref:Uncharacterized protein n=1 Tax=Coccidioides posadasii RMSCC 3488 TaxID=454284 RepID=A0A0J6FF12_COCPO|nr:hypothetical protein CPAG_05231 [Coccidioides posadasii RMSCC 3488]